MIEETWKRTRLAGHVKRFKMAENTCTIFSHSNLSAFVQKNQKINEYNNIEPLQNLNKNFSCKLFYYTCRNFQKNVTDFDRDRRPARFQLSD